MGLSTRLYGSFSDTVKSRVQHPGLYDFLQSIWGGAIYDRGLYTTIYEGSYTRDFTVGTIVFFFEKTF